MPSILLREMGNFDTHCSRQKSLSLTCPLPPGTGKRNLVPEQEIKRAQGGGDSGWVGPSGVPHWWPRPQDRDGGLKGAHLAGKDPHL